MTYFLTFHGMLLCQVATPGVRALTQCPVDAIHGEAEPIGVDVPVEQLRPGFEQFLANAPRVLDRAVTFKNFGTVRLGPAADQRCVTLSWRGQFLSAFADGTIGGGANLSDWESFLPISEA